MGGMRPGKLKSRAREPSVGLPVPTGASGSEGAGPDPRLQSEEGQALDSQAPHFLLRSCQPASLKCISLSGGRQGMAQKAWVGPLGEWS